MYLFDKLDRLDEAIAEGTNLLNTPFSTPVNYFMTLEKIGDLYMYKGDFEKAKIYRDTESFVGSQYFYVANKNPYLAQEKGNEFLKNKGIK
jgi:hypothetical protein